MKGEAVVFADGRLQGVKEARISPLDRGFALGDGLFETMRARKGRVFRLAEHLARLRNGGEILRLSLPWSDDDLAQAIAATIKANDLTDATIRLAVSRGIPERRGLLPSGSPQPILTVQAMPFVGYPPEKYKTGFVAVITSIRRNETSPLSGIKSSNYLDNILARMEAERAGADDALFLNTKDELACATSSNLFLVRDGNLLMPALQCGVLPGITRQVVVELASQRGLRCEERPVGRREMIEAQEAFLTNTLMGVMPLVRVGEKVIGDGEVGEVSRCLYDDCLNLVKNELD
jgi:aminodeoxychorismate lyase